MSAVDPEALQAALARLRPLILGHGGDVVLESLSEDGVVTLRLVGACKACPNMAMTYVGPIRSHLLAVPGVRDVRCPQVHADRRALARIARLSGSRPFDDGGSCVSGALQPASEAVLPLC
ncbi:NifU family protein [Ensifer soli]|uniref:NifU family protein n=1 Tax=Ciceribacter sp. sgz301302 TaxID=3342379 RepID=UPI0035B855E0